MNNTLEIQRYEEQIAVLTSKIQRLEVVNSPAAFYRCLRCGGLYQSLWGCGCVRAALLDAPPPDQEKK